MRDEDYKVNYRPELAEKLDDALKLALKFYNINFKKAYYILMSLAYKQSNPELSNFLEKAAKCFDDEMFGEEHFYEFYEGTLRKEHRFEIVSEARAAYYIFMLYEDDFDKIKENIDISNLTKMEKFMVDDFFKILKAPMKNPNIKISDGETKCYYDRNYCSYKRDLKSSLEHVEKNCTNTIDIFSIAH